MAFGLSNILTSFQRYINKILAEKLDIFVIVYLNDILIYTKNKRLGYIEVVWWVFEKLQKYSLYANLKKCYFHQDKIQFFRYIVLL